MKSVFSKNLRRLCDQKESYAQICREIGISQQHLNHYLSGKHMPREGTLRRISEYFGVDPKTLFLEPDDIGFSSFESNILQYIRGLSKSGQPEIRDGCYSIFFQIPNNSLSIAKGVLIVKNIEGYCTFRRIFLNKVSWTRMGSYYGDNIGVAYKVDEFTYLAAIDKRNRFEPSLLVYEASLEVPSLLIGGGSVVSPFRPSNLASVINIGERKTLREAIAQSGIFRLDELESGDRIIEPFLH